MLDSESHYATRRRKHLGLINTLRALGAQADLDLPRIAVIGNQSAGKSSLVEAISGISVPRDAGTCTRCPIECRMAESSNPWICRVSIRWEFHDNGRRRDKVEEQAFGKEITNPRDVEVALRRAQAAVLNPSIEPKSFLDMTEPMLKQRLPKNELLFSRNAVCVDLSGPGLVDLAFLDLPGIIQNADPEIVGLVEGLVLSHIQGNCLILVTLPMSDDIENQKAMSLARQVDPSGSRTIGVLTKPDTLTSGATRSKELWLDVIEGRDVKFPLKLGYYCTRQPDEDERRAGITTAQARQAEADFFARTLPWSASTYQPHFGTRNLVSHLSKLLTKVIDESLPKIASETARQLQECSSRLDLLPQPISEPSSFVLTLLTRFCLQVNLFVEGSLDAASLVQDSRGAYAKYKMNIRSTAPKFLPYTNRVVAQSELDFGNAARFIRLDDDDGATGSGVAYLYLDDVRSRINQAVTRELPNNIPYVAKISFIKEFQRDWATHTRRVVDSVHQTLQRTVLRLVQDAFGPYNHLEPKVRRAVEDLIRSKLQSVSSQVLRVLRYETTPFTQNDHYLSASKDEFLAQYKSARQNAKTDPKARVTTAQPSPTITPGTRSAAQSTAAPTFSSRSNPFTTIRLHDCPSTAQMPYNGTVVHEEPEPWPIFASITCMLGYANWSFEELRVTDYQQGLDPATNGSFEGSAAKKLGASEASSNPLRRPMVSLPASANPKASASASTSSTPTLGLNDGPSSSTGSSISNGSRGASPPPPTPPFSFSFSAAQSAASSTTLSDEERKREEATILASLAKLGYQGLTVADFGKLVPPDEYEKELEVMAEVRAYFKVAYKRIIDYVPLVIDHEFLRAFANELQEHLIKWLGLGAIDAGAKCAAYLEEDPFVVSTREELAGRKQRLENVQNELAEFGL